MDLGANDAFFVRYHWSGIPTNIDPQAYRVAIKGRVNTPLSLSLDDIKQMGAVQLAAVNQCSGNSRGFSNPRVPGGESANGADLPMLNGYSLRLVVPGYYGTCWVKHLSDIEVVDKPLANFWMATAYRVPDNECACVAPGGKMEKSRPIGRFSIRSFITSVLDGDKIPTSKSTLLRGIAFDGGYGISAVEVSSDGGQVWHRAKLDKSQGKYSFNEWTRPFKPARRGALELKVRATNRIGQSQPVDALWNPSGYMRNVIETTRVTVL